MCECIIDQEECPDGNACTYCHSELELLYHPVEYKTKMCQRGSHPHQDHCPHAHTEDELRDVSGYKDLMNFPKKKRLELIDHDEEKNDTSGDVVAELPSQLKSEKGGRMKKSISLNYTNPGGFEAAMQTPSKRNNKRKKKGKNKGKYEGKGVEAI